ncbi:hypothetical protein [Buttiauxella ferragutiae]|uniref:hypothetical protein n=1 Tax=Buttiauxella ferragutiae TaxID=82989 RepID=UPI001F53423D|nr:hypothetical protein [Buttiauxella ferragutiae]UNK62472.1 hypothetical protein MNO13_05885 [Buttiauxella ferragutiae]
MKTLTISLSIGLLAMLTSGASISSTQKNKSYENAFEECGVITNKAVSNWGDWASTQGLTPQELRKIVGTMCINGITAARDSQNKTELSLYWNALATRFRDAGLAPLSVNAVWDAQKISMNYFMSLHPDLARQESERERIASEEKARKDTALDTDIGFPLLTKNHTQEQFNTAYNYFINTKKVKGGLSIRETCEKAIKENSFLSNFSFTQMVTAHGYDEQAIIVCQNVMVYAVSNGRYGDSPQKITISSNQGDLSKFSYPGNKYMAIVAEWAGSNAK